MVADQKLQRCPKPDCGQKRLQPEKPPEEPKVLIGKEAKKIIDAAETGDGTAWMAEDELEKHRELKNLKKTIEDARKFGWKDILEMSERKLAA